MRLRRTVRHGRSQAACVDCEYDDVPRYGTGKSLVGARFRDESDLGNFPRQAVHAVGFGGWLSVAWALFHCTLGDVAIALAMFALAAIMLRHKDWPVSRPWAGGAIVVIGALAFTAWSEWYNVYRAGSWGYTSSMALIFGIGLSPLLQWLVLPPVMVVAYRALGSVLLGWHEAQTPIQTDDFTRGPT